MNNVQRARILAAVIDVCAERGAANVTVADIVGRAGISRRTFYELYEDCEESVLAALDNALACASRQVLEAYESHTRWRERIRASLTALLHFLEAEPQMARLLIVESYSAGARALERRRRTTAALVAAVEAGRAESKHGALAPQLAGEGVVGAVLSVIHARVVEVERPILSELLNPLMSLIVLPYLGPAAARAELARPSALPVEIPRSPSSHPFAGLEMRLTYRTTRVLAAVAAAPGSSNREIGHAAGIGDQGQISKLLARLRGLGLIENTGRLEKGAANEWRLTDKGRELHRALALER